MIQLVRNHLVYSASCLARLEETPSFMAIVDAGRALGRWFELQGALRACNFPRILGVENPYPLLTPAGNPRLPVYRFLAHIGGKGPSRLLFEGGPIRQPRLFFNLEGDQSVLKNALSHSSDPLSLGREPLYSLKDFSPPPLFGRPGTVREFRVAVQEILDRRIPLPVVCKPNFGANGSGIFFITSGRGDELTVTMSAVPFSDRDRRTIEALLGKPPHLGLDLDFTLRAEEGIMEMPLNGAKPEMVEKLYRLWAFVSGGTNPGNVPFSVGAYDPGMMETIEPIFRYGNRAYETRHYVIGHLGTGAAHVQRGESFGKVGQSSFFASVSRRRGAYNLPSDQMFHPLFCEYRASDGQLFFKTVAQRTAFEWYVERMLVSEFRYLSLRLRAAGIHLDGAVGAEFDLAWLPGPHDFPEPLLIEFRIRNWGRGLPLNDILPNALPI